MVKVSTFFKKNKKQRLESVPSTSSSTAVTLPLVIQTNSEMSDKPESAKYVQQTLEQNCEARKIWNINDKRSRAIHFKIGEMIALDNQPYSIVDDMGFKSLLQELRPNYKIPKRKYFTDTIVPTIYESAKTFMQKSISMASFMSITTDIWSSNSKDSYISCTGHCVFENFDQQVLVLHVKPFPKSHTGENISEIIRNMINNYDIPKNKIHEIVHDNASNMICGIGSSGFDSLTCFIHTVQLAINECILTQGYVADTITKCKKLAAHFSRSNLACMKLREIQGRLKKKELRIIVDNSTRWNSVYLMLKRIVELKTDLIIYCSENSRNCDIQFENLEWTLMQKTVGLLKIFYDMTVR